MDDIREVVRKAAPPVADLDLDAVRVRVQQVHQVDRRRARIRFGVIVGAVVALVALTVGSLLLDMDAGRGGGLVAVGESAEAVHSLVAAPNASGGINPLEPPTPTFSPATMMPQPGGTRLAAIEGQSVLGEGTISLGDFASQPMLVYVWPVQCQTCAEGLPVVARANETSFDVVVVGIAVGNDRAAAADAMVGAGVDMPTLLVENPEELTPGLFMDDEVNKVPGMVAVSADQLAWASAGGEPTPENVRWLAARATYGPDPIPQELVSTPPLSATPPSPTAIAIPAAPPSPIPTVPADSLYVVQEGDTLSTIAEKMYGDPRAFEILATTNDVNPETPLTVGRELVIPVTPASTPTESADQEPLPVHWIGAVEALTPQGLSLAAGDQVSFGFYPAAPGQSPAEVFAALLASQRQAGALIVSISDDPTSFTVDVAGDAQPVSRELTFETPDGAITLMVESTTGQGVTTEVRDLQRLATSILAAG